MNDRGIFASYLLSPLYKITNPELASQCRLVKDPDSNRVIVLLRNKTRPITLYHNMFRATDKNLKLQGSLPKKKIIKTTMSI